MSPWRPITLRCSTSTPAWPCTIGFGRPVVPDEYSTYSGCSASTATNSIGSLSASSSSQATVPSPDALRRPGTARRRSPPRSASRPGSSPARRPDSRSGGRSGTRRRRATPSVRPARIGRAPPGPRTPAHTTSRSHRGCGREEGDDRLRDVGQIGRDAVALADAEASEPAPGSRDLLGQLAPGQFDPVTRSASAPRSPSDPIVCRPSGGCGARSSAAHR